MGGSLNTFVGGKPVRVGVQTNYPWDGNIRFSIGTETPVAFALRLRIPGWCEKYTLTVNGSPEKSPVVDGYAVIDRTWQDGDRVELALDMPVSLIHANPRVYEDAGKVAVSRGPLVYCLEEADNGRNLHSVRLGNGRAESFSAEWKPDKLGGIVELRSPGIRETDTGWGETLYSSINRIESDPVVLTWIPYYSWANRDPGEMRVWIRE